MYNGLILKKQADLFTIELENGEVKDVVARKNLKKDGLFVGDRVVVDADNTICKLEKRKNILVRPPVANIDKMFIVIAPVPKPDLYLVDKLLIFCALSDIEPVLCINKSDLDLKFGENIEKTYKKLAKVLIFSTFDDSVE
ncbi:MAG: GTPase RsgA, partial [Clostridia bacterium]|nr:GTPase RsgA [Clostridia bacterium]